MKTVRSIVGRSPVANTASPHTIAPMDPYAGDEALVWLGSHKDYLRHAKRLGVEADLDVEAYALIDLEFERVYRDILDGQAPWDSIDPLAKILLLGQEVAHDQRPPGEALVAIPDQQLADIAENQIPGVGLVGPDRILGPWADEPLPAWLRIQVGAIMAFVPELDPGVPSWARAIKRKPRPPTEVRQTLRVMARSAPNIWLVEGCDLVPLLPLGRHFLPKGPVLGVPDVPAVIGRVVHGPRGPVLVASVPLLRVPPVEVIERRVRLEWLRLRRRERRLTWEDSLRERSEVLYRSCCEWLWLQFAETDTRPW